MEEKLKKVKKFRIIGPIIMALGFMLFVSTPILLVTTEMFGFVAFAFLGIPMIGIGSALLFSYLGIKKQIEASKMAKEMGVQVEQTNTQAIYKKCPYCGKAVEANDLECDTCGFHF